MAPVAAASLCEGEGLTIATVRQQAVFKVTLKDEAGEALRGGDGSDGLSIHVRGSGVHLRSKIVCEEDGTYTVTYMPESAWSASLQAPARMPAHQLRRLRLTCANSESPTLLFLSVSRSIGRVHHRRQVSRQPSARQPLHRPHLHTHAAPAQLLRQRRRAAEAYLPGAADARRKVPRPSRQRGAC